MLDSALNNTTFPPTNRLHEHQRCLSSNLLSSRREEGDLFAARFFFPIFLSRQGTWACHLLFRMAFAYCSYPSMVVSSAFIQEFGAVFIPFLAGTGKGLLRPAQTCWPQAFSPFSAPDLQDAEVPYKSLPVDKGHLLPITRLRSGVSLLGCTASNFPHPLQAPSPAMGRAL